MEQAGKSPDQKKMNPLILVAVIVSGLIVFIFASSDRGQGNPEKVTLNSADQTAQSTQTGADNQAGKINRGTLPPGGLRARELIQQIRDKGKPYPMDQLMAQASAYANDGNLADAYLTFYFAAREGSVDAMIMMAEMSDPTMFQSENNLLDRADAIQAFKWYKQALDKGFEPARSRLSNLHQWAKAEANYGNKDAKQLLLNF